MSDRRLASAWEALTFIRAWHSRHSIPTADGWLAVMIGGMWLSGDPPSTTLTAAWRVRQEDEHRQATVPIWNRDGSPGSAGLRDEILVSAHGLGAEGSRPARDRDEVHDLFEATCVAWLWKTAKGPATTHSTQSVGLIGAYPETRLAIEFPTPNGLEELTSEIWREPGRPEAASEDLAFDLWVRFMEGG
jgi:hypothetical protein